MTDDFSPYPYWWDAAPPSRMAAPDILPKAVDAIVIGAGFTGLAAARSLASAGRKTLVLDAEKLGYGASTRNGGMAGSGTRLSIKKLTARYGGDRARRLLLESLEAVDGLETLIKEYAIDCDFVRSGRVLTAWRKRDLAAFARHAEDINALRPNEATVIDADRLRAEEVNSPRYHGGLLLRSHGSLHPAKLYAALLDIAERSGVQLVPETPVTELRRETGHYQVQTPTSEVRAPLVIVATNGYTSSSLPWMARRLLPVPSYIVASEPMPGDQLAAMLPGIRMITEKRGRHSYYRRSPDGTRLVLGARASFGRIPLKLAASRLQRMITDLFPTAAPFRYTHCWTGFVAFTGNFLPFIAEHDGVHYVGGYGGNGVALSHYLGRKAALRALGVDGGATAFAEIAPTTPPQFMLPAELVQRGIEMTIKGWDLADALVKRKG